MGKHGIELGHRKIKKKVSLTTVSNSRPFSENMSKIAKNDLKGPK